MPKIYKGGLIAAAVGAVLVSGSAALADPIANVFGTNATVYDGLGSGTSWWGSQEDNEVEPNCYSGQQWDLEGVFLSDNTLSMVGGWDFQNGLYFNGRQYSSGDLFIDNIDVGGMANTYGYDFVYDLDFAALTYQVVALDNTSVVSQVTDIAQANPWQWVSGGTVIGSGLIDYETGLGDADVSFLGGTHNAASVDIALVNDLRWKSHFTMECGNDNLIGVPEPGTFGLFFSGVILMIGMGWIRRKETSR